MFKVGDRVKYVSGRWLEGEYNPLWEKYKIAGTIDGIDHTGECPIYVSWDNGKHNVYKFEDLALLGHSDEAKINDKSVDKENGMKINDTVAKVTKNTDDAILVSKHFDAEIPTTFTGLLQYKMFEKEYLAEAKRLEEEEKNK